MSSFMADEAMQVMLRRRAQCAALAGDMDIVPVFSHCSALEYWGTSPPPDCRLPANKHHIVFADKAKRRRYARVITHSWKGEFLVEHAGVYDVTRPAMTWAQMSRYCSEESLAVIAGSFACRDRRRRVASIDELVRYATDTKGFQGRARCMGIAPFLAANTDSPPESQVYVLAMRNGLGTPSVNHCVMLGPNDCCFIDIAYPDIKLGIEYQGGYHAGVDQMRADARRLNRLRLAGWEIVLVTADDLIDDAARRRIVQVIRVMMQRQRHLMGLARVVI
ncbi:hypothetical protein DSM100688_1369 [Bifidobacterium ramosum]|uniref:DUF559 domain-containing protein n=1 Tax=Bifidobacterium ramosum TaxID=1798158 RepID=A0A6L4X0F6_9BIFI|nr:hypothetical protein [Bifidobacterium ramosum]KAB8287583.1 hypothetical protein DSM100688_1369 [Bifidobacterium ramosum]NEG72607.1 hypothetical protein [Bifidobacterium ramosum]